jgi:sialidase-1
MAVTSDDRGRTWSAKKAVNEGLRKASESDPHWNCARVVALSDGRLCVIVDRIAGAHEGNSPSGEQSNWLYFSSDDGETWSGPVATPARGIVPDRLVELSSGRWIISAHSAESGVWTQSAWLSDDKGETWVGPQTVAAVPDLMLCEGTIFELPGGELCCLMRENSGRGLDAFKSVSQDAGQTWGPVTAIAIPGCHRPVGGLLQSGFVLVTYRFHQGGSGWHGAWCQNLFAALTDVESCLSADRAHSHTRILPLDFDRHLVSDLGYSGWVQFPDGEIYVVNYIKDDAPQAHIRGYSLTEADFMIK